MKKRLLRDSALAILASLIIAFVIAVPIVKSIHMRQIQNDLKATLALLYQERMDNQLEDEAFADKYALLLKKSGQDIRITLMNTNGEVLGESEKESRVEQNHMDREEVKQAVDGEFGFAQRKSEVTGNDYYYAAYRQGNFILRIAVPLVDLRQFDNTLLLCTVIGIAAGLAVAMVLTGLFTKRFVQPIQSLAEASTAIARGKLDTPVPKAPYELGLLSDTLNGMSEDLRQAQNHLKESNDNLNSILQGMDDGVIAVKEGSIVLLTGRAASMLGIPPAGARRLEQCGANYLFIQDVLNKAQASELPVEEDITLHLPSERIIHVYAARLQPNNSTALLAVLSDITKLKELENLRSEFVANVTHELKTPLTSICGYVELLKGPARDQEQIRQFCEIIEIETERLKYLIEELLELSHLENSKEKSPLERIYLEQVIKRVAERTAPLAQKAEIELKWQVQPGLCLEAESNRIEEIIQNLTINAIKYGKPGGYAAITAREERGAVVIRVSDDGIGIPADSIPRIFERFYRVDKSRSREQGGTGLGLSIVKHVVNLYHGDVSVDSKEGDGSVFTVRLPKQQN